jgi:hypothetical protein
MEAKQTWSFQGQVFYFDILKSLPKSILFLPKLSDLFSNFIVGA